MAPVNQGEEGLSIETLEQAAERGDLPGAEIVILGKCLADHSRTLKIGQYEMNFYTARLYLRAFNAATGEVLLSGNYNSDDKIDTSALSRSDAAANAVENCIRMSQKDILFQIVRNWYDGFSKPMVHHVTVSNIDYDQLIKLKIKLHALEGVRTIFERGYSERVGRLEIKYEGPQDKLADDILAAKLPIKILKKEQNLLVLEHQ
jgi:hypothetical protein